MEEKTPEQIKQEELQSLIRKFAKEADRVVSNNWLVNQGKKSIFGQTFNEDNIVTYLSNPTKYQKELIKLSQIMFAVSPQYASLVNYYPSLVKIVSIVTPNMDKFTNVKGELTDPEKLKKEYLKCTSYIDTMRLEHNFKNILFDMIMNDVYFAYVLDDMKGNYGLLKLDPNYCFISSINNGCYAFYFDYSFFDSQKNIKIIGDLIESYPDEFKKGYARYQADKTNMRYQELSIENTICFKLNEGIEYSLPKFASTFRDIFDLNEYKQLAKATTAQNVSKFIAFQLESMKDGQVDSYTTSLEIVLQFWNALNSSLGENISSFIAPCPIEPISFSTNSQSNRNEVLEATNSLLNSAGIASANMGVEATNAGLAKISNEIDASYIYKIYRQWETWLNQRIKRLFNEKFSVDLMDVTTLNISEKIDMILKVSQYSTPSKLMLSSLIGISQSKERSLTTLESVLDLTNSWTPLTSSHTSVSGEVGGQTKDVTDLTDSGQATADSSSNSNRI